MRININYILDAKAAEECFKINQKFCKQFSDSEIDFSKGCRPHMTLLMGEIDEKNLDFVAEMVKNMQFSSVGKIFKLTKPYAKGEYIFVDAVDLAPFINDCSMLLQRLDGVLVPHRFLISNGTTKPHISLCYSKTADLKLFAESITELNTAKLVGVVVSKTGDHGTCLLNGEEGNKCEKK